MNMRFVARAVYFRMHRYSLECVGLFLILTLVPHLLPPLFHHRRLLPASTFSVHCAIDFRHPLITDQKCALEVNARSFVRDIARARTFGFVREVEWLRARMGFGRRSLLEEEAALRASQSAGAAE